MGGKSDLVTRTWVIMLVLFFGCCVTTIAAAAVSQVAAQDQIRIQCGYTRFPRLCVQTLSGLVSGERVDFAAALLLNKTIAHADLHIAHFDQLSSHFVSSQPPQPRLQAIGYCEELMGMARQRLNEALVAMKESPGKNRQEDIQTWLSAAVTFQQACKDWADQYAFSDELFARISRSMDYQSQLASNALALVNRNTEISAAGRQLSEEDIDDDDDGGFFPDWVSGRDLRLLETTTDKTKANVVVAKDGTGNFRTVAEAIGAASGRQRFVIYVKSGVYKEKIRSSKDGITLIGDGKYSTIITWDDSVGGGSSLTGSATFGITGDGFIAKDIGFQNTAGPGAHQAVALTVASDHSVFYRCSISGYQDTLYALSLRQFYRECDISGTVDFIFGNAAAVFQACNLVLRRPSSYNVILANGRSDPGQNTGFSVQKCKITPGPDFSPVKNSYNSYLGRPWKPYSRAVVMESDIDGAISARGWIEWPGTSSSSVRELYFGEYANVGARGGLGGRVGWPGFHAMGKEEAEKFTVAKFIDGNSWLPSTGINFVPGL
ncbi:PREDICTED: pectinesterase-like [Ipomoea nil]|uniref:pectinesterase-like n=1 Tax=Ipomoea nil TaxID=35883 RepID=UPI0009011705|nr:PREDICTED: pectinesterase-like [Ipomoea nil]